MGRWKMKNFDELIEIVERLLAPDGCPWDREQTVTSLRPYLIEEVYEIVEAIDLDDNTKISEEVGDVFFHLVFICKLAEKEGRFTLAHTLQSIADKLIRRHPHVFGEAQIESVDEVVAQWELIKKKEKSDRKSALDDIPKDLPALAKAQKMLSKFNKLGFEWEKAAYLDMESLKSEEEWGTLLLTLVMHASKQGINAKHALLKKLTQLEKAFRDQEQQQ